MTYRIGGVEMEGEKPVNVIEAVFGRKVTDGGKARIKRSRELWISVSAQPVRDIADDLVMDHADTAPCEYVAPDHDCA